MSNVNETIFGENATGFDYWMSLEDVGPTESIKIYADVLTAGDQRALLLAFVHATASGTPVQWPLTNAQIGPGFSMISGPKWPAKLQLAREYSCQFFMRISARIHAATVRYWMRIGLHL